MAGRFKKRARSEAMETYFAGCRAEASTFWFDEQDAEGFVCCRASAAPALACKLMPPVLGGRSGRGFTGVDGELLTGVFKELHGEFSREMQATGPDAVAGPELLLLSLFVLRATHAQTVLFFRFALQPGVADIPDATTPEMHARELVARLGAFVEHERGRGLPYVSNVAAVPDPEDAETYVILLLLLLHWPFFARHSPAFAGWPLRGEDEAAARRFAFRTMRAAVIYQSSASPAWAHVLSAVVFAELCRDTRGLAQMAGYLTISEAMQGLNDARQKHLAVARGALPLKDSEHVAAVDAAAKLLEYLRARCLMRTSELMQLELQHSPVAEASAPPPLFARALFSNTMDKDPQLQQLVVLKDYADMDRANEVLLDRLLEDIERSRLRPGEAAPAAHQPAAPNCSSICVKAEPAAEEEEEEDTVIEEEEDTVVEEDTVIEEEPEPHVDEPTSPEQLELLRRELRQPMSLVYGPPGSGKTSRGLKYVARHYAETLKLGWPSVVCLAPTGKAFNELVKACIPVPEAAAPVAAAPENNPFQEFNCEEEEEEEGEKERAAPGDEIQQFREWMLASEGELLAEDLRGAPAMAQNQLNIYESDCHQRRPACFAEARAHVYSAFGLGGGGTLQPPKEYTLASAEARLRDLRMQGGSALSGTIDRFVRLVSPARAARLQALLSLPGPKRVVVIVDETSMISTSLMHRLLLSLFYLRSNGVVVDKLIFCGDNQQLPPISYGGVFSALLDSEAFRAFHCEYRAIHRQQREAQELVQLVTHTRAQIDAAGGRSARLALADLPHGDGDGSSFQVDAGPETYHFASKQATNKHMRDTNARRVEAYLRDHRRDILDTHPMRKVVSYRSLEVDAWNTAIQTLVRETMVRRWPVLARQDAVRSFHCVFHVFDRVMRCKNVHNADAPEGLSEKAHAACSRFFANGSEAVVLSVDAQRQCVELEYASDGERELVSFKTMRTDFRLSYASTVHSIQGATLARVLYHVPDTRVPLTLNMQLFWVAVSRAQRSLRLVGPDLLAAPISLVPATPFTAFLETSRTARRAGACTRCGAPVLSGLPWAPYVAFMNAEGAGSRAVSRAEGLRGDCPRCGAEAAVRLELHPDEASSGVLMV